MIKTYYSLSYILKFFIELYNNKSHGLSPPGGSSSLFFDQAVTYYPQRHLADCNAIYILHQLDCARPHVEGLCQLIDVAIFVVLQPNENQDS